MVIWILIGIMGHLLDPGLYGGCGSISLLDREDGKMEEDNA